MPLIGAQIPWKDITDQYFRIKQHVRLGKFTDGKAIPVSLTTPYALLEIEAPTLPQGATMPVAHPVDFVNLIRIFDERMVGPREEVLVVYSPPTGIARFSAQPRLMFLVHRRGYLDKLYDSQRIVAALEERPLAILHGLTGSF